MNRRLITLSLATLTFAAWLPAAHAQTAAWPDKPVKLVLSQPAGSGPDNVARLLSERLAKSWSQPVVIDNKPGGQNTIGAQAVARAPADGGTFYFATTAALITNPLLFKTLPYDPQKDFVPVGFVARSPFAVLVEASSPIKSIEELIAKSKTDPGKLTLGNEGPRTFSGMIARLFNARTGAQANLVSYSSVGVGAQDLMGKHIDAMVADLASTAQLAKQGRMRVLATTSAKRVAGWEQVPSLSETMPGFDMVGWFAVVAPTGTPSAAIARFNRDLGTLLAEKDTADRIAAMGPIAEPNVSVEQTGAFLRNEMVRWTAITKEIGVLPE
jgi:tripartite-type tricarboxylate transporter receptor subunit TctC